MRGLVGRRDTVDQKKNDKRNYLLLFHRPIIRVDPKFCPIGIRYYYSDPDHFDKDPDPDFTLVPVWIRIRLFTLIRIRIPLFDPELHCFKEKLYLKQYFHTIRYTST
jgi:hypothetical protein